MQNFAYIQQRAQQFRFIANITTRSLWIKYELPIEKHTCHSAWFVRRALSRFSLALSLSAFLLFCHARCRLNTPIDIVCCACFFLLNSLFSQFLAVPLFLFTYFVYCTTRTAIDFGFSLDCFISYLICVCIERVLAVCVFASACIS